MLTTSPHTPSTHDSQDRDRLPVRSWILGVIGFAFLVLAGFSATGMADDHDEAIETTRTTIEKLVETRRIISSEKQNWKLGKQLLEDRIELVSRQIESLRESIAKAEKDIETTDTDGAKFEEEYERLTNASEGLSDLIAEFEARTRDLVRRLPQVYRERLAPLTQQMPGSPDAAERMSLSQRYIAVLGVLNTLDKMNQETLVVAERRTLSDGTEAEVTVMYLGISQGFYVTSDETAAGVGTATTAGWLWKDADAAAPEIAKAIRILENEDVASFVKLPITIN